MAAVLASLLVLLALLLAALLYVKCRLNVLLWYQDAYGEVEMNGEWGMDGRELWGSVGGGRGVTRRGRGEHGPEKGPGRHEGGGRDPARGLLSESRAGEGLGAAGGGTRGGGVWGAGLRPDRGETVGNPGQESGRADPPPSADGKLYDAYVSYSDSPEDRKFVNFILKPQLERRRGYKLFLDDRDLLPHAGTAAPRPAPSGPHPVPARAPPPRRPDLVPPYFS